MVTSIGIAIIGLQNVFLLTLPLPLETERNCAVTNVRSWSDSYDSTRIRHVNVEHVASLARPWASCWSMLSPHRWSPCPASDLPTKSIKAAYFQSYFVLKDALSHDHGQSINFVNGIRSDRESKKLLNKSVWGFIILWFWSSSAFAARKVIAKYTNWDRGWSQSKDASCCASWEASVCADCCSQTLRILGPIL